MKKNILLAIVTLFSFAGTSQTLVKIANPTTTHNLFAFGEGTTIGSNFYCSYSTGAGVFSVLKYDGSTATLLDNPTSVSGVFTGVQPNFVEYNGSLHAVYLDAGPEYKLVKLVGNTLTLIANPIATAGVKGLPVVYNGNLYFGYINASLNVQLARYNGTAITLINTPTINGSNELNSHLKVFNGNLLYYYAQNGGEFQLASFNGTTSTLFNNPTTDGKPINLDKSLQLGSSIYFQYKNDITGIFQLAKFDGSTVSLIPNPDAGIGFDSVGKGGVVMNGNMYWRYKNSAGIYKIARCNGNNITLINYPTATGKMLFTEGIMNDFTVLNNTLYYCYLDNSTANIAKYDGATTTLLPNINANNATLYPIVYNNSLFATNFNLTTQKYNLAKWNGTSFNLINNPSSSDEGINPTFTSIFNGSLIIGYIEDIATGVVQLAKYTEVLPILLTNFTLLQNSENIILNWKSASEINALHYNIEKSIDGNPASQQGRYFETIGKVTAKGVASNYNFIDEKPSTGVNYYKLKMVDKDGKYEYSKTVTIIYNTKPTTVSMYPNPIHNNEVKIVLATKPNTPVNYSIYNSQGILLQQGKINAQTQTLNLLKPNTGVYCIKMSNGYTGTFIKN